MSTYWDLGCRTCNKKAGLRTRAEGHLVEVVASAERIMGIVHEAERLGGEFDITVESWRTYDHGSVTKGARFAMEHRGHEVMPVSEYGQWYDRCRRVVRCDCCGAVRNCGLELGHETPCKISEKD